jgi:hypothetical protein
MATGGFGGGGGGGFGGSTGGGWNQDPFAQGGADPFATMAIQGNTALIAPPAQAPPAASNPFAADPFGGGGGQGWVQFGAAGSGAQAVGARGLAAAGGNTTGPSGIGSDLLGVFGGSLAPEPRGMAVMAPSASSGAGWVVCCQTHHRVHAYMRMSGVVLCSPLGLYAVLFFCFCSLLCPCAYFFWLSSLPLHFFVFSPFVVLRSAFRLKHSSAEF